MKFGPAPVTHIWFRRRQSEKIGETKRKCGRLSEIVDVKLPEIASLLYWLENMLSMRVNEKRKVKTCLMRVNEKIDLWDGAFHIWVSWY